MRRQLQVLVSSNPGDVTVRLWLANVEAAKDNCKTAVEHYRAVVAAEPDNAEALNNLACGLAEYVGDSNEALKFAKNSEGVRARFAGVFGYSRVDPLPPRALFLSVKEIERATGKGRDPVWDFHLAKACAKAGEERRARAVFKPRSNATRDFQKPN